MATQTSTSRNVNASLGRSISTSRTCAPKAAILGQVGSSTRSEAHGLLVAIARKGSVHVGIDNSTVVKRANKYLTMAARLCAKRDDFRAQEADSSHAMEIARQLRRPEKKHWQLQKDGDIWQAIWQAIIAKGPQAIRVTKVKGHATSSEVSSGKVEDVDKVGNDISDKLAAEGTLLHGEDKINLANWIAARHRAYCEFMDMIQVFIINMMTADKEARDLKAKQSNPFSQPCMPLVDILIKLRYIIDV